MFIKANEICKIRKQNILKNSWPTHFQESYFKNAQRLSWIAVFNGTEMLLTTGIAE
jgi:hypothetical protein